MKEVKGNPAANALPRGIAENELKDAIARSGYPLQIEVAAALRKRFRDTKTRFGIIEEEWSYVDRDSNELRSLDISAQIELWNFETGQPRVRPGMTLLIECKRSEHPFIFFKMASPGEAADFPMWTGMHMDQFAFQVDVLHRLRLDQAQSLPPTCTTFAKAQPDGKRVILSGSEPFNAIVLPLTKAMEYLRKLPISKSSECRAVLGLGILDAPMILVEVGSTGPAIRLAPWIRLIRREAERASDSAGGSTYYSIDLVHAKFFDQYLETTVLPLADSLRKGVIRMQDELLWMLGQDQMSDQPADVIAEIDHEQT